MAQTWTLTRKTGPVATPVTINQAKANLRLAASSSQHDELLDSHIRAATEQLEHDTDRALISQTFVEYSDELHELIVLHKSPVISVVEIRYVDSDGVPQILDPAKYTLDKGRRQIHAVDENDWPDYQAGRNNVQIEYVAGYGDSADNVPRMIQGAILLQVGKWFRDPSMESAESYSHDESYERIVRRLFRTGYP